MPAGKTRLAKSELKASRMAALAKRAGRLAKENRKKGYH